MCAQGILVGRLSLLERLCLWLDGLLRRRILRLLGGHLLILLLLFPTLGFAHGGQRRKEAGGFEATKGPEGREACGRAGANT